MPGRTSAPPRSKSYAFRLQADAADILEARAEAIGIPPGAYVRRLLQLWLALPDPVPERWTRADRGEGKE